MEHAPFTIRVALVTLSGFPFAEAYGPAGGEPVVDVHVDAAGDPDTAIFTSYARADVEKVARDAWIHADNEARNLTQ